MKVTKKGFTLVEIMIVVAIIGIIIAIAVPAFLRARENARGQACQENLTKIDGAKEQYALEARVANGTPVTIDDLVTPTVNGVQAGVGEGYLRDAEMTCPADNALAYAVNAIGVEPTCAYAEPAWAVQHEMPDQD